MNEEIVPTDKKIKVIRDKISQKTIDRLNSMHEQIMRSAVEVARKAIELGEELIATKKLVKYGTWEIWVEDNLSYDLRTAQRYMRAAKRKGELLTNPVGFMAQLYGNTEPSEDKRVKEGRNDVDVVSNEGDEGDGDESEKDEKQHGGEGLNFSGGDKKQGFFTFKILTAQLEREFFKNPIVTLEEKISFISEMITWLRLKEDILSTTDSSEIEKDI